MSTSKFNHITQIAVMAAIMIALSFVPSIPVGPTPIVLENLGVMLAGVMLGTARGTVAVVLFILLKVIGISATGSGLALLIGPNSGYVYGWILMPFLINLFMKLCQKHLNVIVLFLIIALVSVVVDDFIAGTLGLTLICRLMSTAIPFSKAMMINVLVTPGDIIKALIVAIIGKQLMKSEHMRSLLR